ncbi:MAG: zeta toxin family protein [Cyanobacteria bacterium]|nr:zeta toxin family protein [Cyanobacteriota bacterium]
MRLKKAGYQITAKVVACHERVSTIGIFMRYESQKAQKGFGRFSDLVSHDDGYKGMPKTLEHIERTKLVDRIEVFDR